MILAEESLITDIKDDARSDMTGLAVLVFGLEAPSYMIDLGAKG